MPVISAMGMLFSLDYNPYEALASYLDYNPGIDATHQGVEPAMGEVPGGNHFRAKLLPRASIPPMIWQASDSAGFLPLTSILPQGEPVVVESVKVLLQVGVASARSIWTCPIIALSEVNSSR